MEVEVKINEQNENESLCIDVEDCSNLENVVNMDILKQSNTTKPDSMVSESMVTEPIVPDITKFNHDVQHGYRVYCQLLSDQYRTITQPFLEPVDVQGLALWDYHDRIETPMSFTQIENKFKSYLYQSITEVISDIRLILENCYRYNGLEHWVSKQAQKLENVLDQKLALLNRSLRDKVTLQATMAFRGNKTRSCDQDDSGRRRRSGRTSYGSHPDQTSRLVNHLLVQKEEIQKELKKMKEKEKKEAHGVLMVELNEWENEIFTPKILNDIYSLWEIPSIGSFLWLFQEVLNLPELNYSEFEYGLIMPHKSKLISSIFSVLLSTPSQRKTIHKRTPMTFSTWHKKLKDRLDYWYMTRIVEEFKMAGYQIGLDGQFFQVIGNVNPLEKSSYVDLTLHQRVVILKVLCDECLDYDYQLRDYLGNADTTPFREVILGHDDNNYSYLYFPIFDITDLRIYKQAALPSVTEWYKKWRNHYDSSGDWLNETCVGQKEGHRKPGTRQKSKASHTTTTTTIPDGFKLVCRDVETLRDLCTKFADHETSSSCKKRRGRPARKQCEKALHRRLTSLLDELCVSETRYSKARTKAMLTLMKDWKTEEQPDTPNVQSNMEEEMEVLSNTPELRTTEETNNYEGNSSSSVMENFDDSFGRITRNKLKNKGIYDSRSSSPKTPYNCIEEKSTTQESTIQESATQESAIEKSTIQESTTQESSTIQENTTLSNNGTCLVSENTDFRLKNEVEKNFANETPVSETQIDVAKTKVLNDSKMIQNNSETTSNDPNMISNDSNMIPSNSNMNSNTLKSPINASSNTQAYTTVPNTEMINSNISKKSSVSSASKMTQNEMKLQHVSEAITNITGSSGSVKDNKDSSVVNGEDGLITSSGNQLEHCGINGDIMGQEGTGVFQNGHNKIQTVTSDNSEESEPINKKHCPVNSHLMVTDSKLVMVENTKRGETKDDVVMDDVKEVRS